jgi:hypothetical protein
MTVVVLSGEPVFIDTQGLILLIGLAILILILAPKFLEWFVGDRDTL